MNSTQIDLGINEEISAQFLRLFAVRQSPTYPKAEKLTHKDVWGDSFSKGLVIAGEGEQCPVWGDILQGAVTVVCNKEVFEEVAYWLECVHGAQCITRVRDLGRSLAIRSNRQGW